MSELWQSRPDTSQFPEFYRRYVDRVEVGDPPAVFGRQLAEVLALLSPLGENQALLRYAPGKWSLKELVGHLSDCERILSTRALRFARGDATELPGFDEADFVAGANCDARALTELLDEFRRVREATIALFEPFDATQLERRGLANGALFSVRAQGWIIAGHVAHHLAVIRERYLAR